MILFCKRAASDNALVVKYKRRSVSRIGFKKHITETAPYGAFGAADFYIAQRNLFHDLIYRIVHVFCKYAYTGFISDRTHVYCREVYGVTYVAVFKEVHGLFYRH